jgi:hypothetical protein
MIDASFVVTMIMRKIIKFYIVTDAILGYIKTAMGSLE